ncbi:hypothetical protein AALP_AA4G060500 [Arabis alpina]|uniref:Uncharacterized protein n=1 Tax=Arabis alpina TaxID=50452 RepID=A0A087H1G0_ARAAL|nr:hypothetical protein AALP_AA4G060500 [Arabis alpina]
MLKDNKGQKENVKRDCISKENVGVTNPTVFKRN